MIRQSVGAEVIAKRMCDLLQSFPAAAVTGVQWQILVRKYEERHSTKLDIRSMGFDSALAAATTLLWDVLRVVDSEDTANPVVALEENVALTPLPGFLASWPSLYQAFHNIVQQSGTASLDDSSAGSELLLSKLKPMLQKHWHQSFNESGLCYLNEAGSGMQLKKMKHLTQAVLRWRNQYFEELSPSAKRGELYAALKPQLELAPSKTHNDVVLRYVPASSEISGSADLCETSMQVLGNPELTADPKSDAGALDVSDSASTCESLSAELEQELAELRAENTSLRVRNEQLQNQHESHERARMLPFKQAFLTTLAFSASDQKDLLDDPFEPPPQLQRFWSSPGPSTGPGSSVGDADYSLGSGGTTPRSSLSGSATPIHNMPPAHLQFGGFGPQGQVCAFVPIWWDRTRIPCGIVQQARAIFDRKDEVLPSFFNQC